MGLKKMKSLLVFALFVCSFVILTAKTAGNTNIANAEGDGEILTGSLLDKPLLRRETRDLKKQKKRIKDKKNKVKSKDKADKAKKKNGKTSNGKLKKNKKEGKGTNKKQKGNKIGKRKKKEKTQQ